VIKDMAGILSPIAAEDWSRPWCAVNLPIQVHTHATSGMGTATYVEGVRAGAGAIDCAISVMSSRSSQPPVETMLAIFNETIVPRQSRRRVPAQDLPLFRGTGPETRSRNMPINPIDPEILCIISPAA
jgi:oxaloacetate decarboxylase (Na+ extruding) subunit alpha